MLLLVTLLAYRLGFSRRPVDPPVPVDLVPCQVSAWRALPTPPAAPVVAPVPAPRLNWTKGALAGRSVSAVSLGQDEWRSW